MYKTKYFCQEHNVLKKGIVKTCQLEDLKIFLAVSEQYTGGLKIKNNQNVILRSGIQCRNVNLQGHCKSALLS